MAAPSAETVLVCLFDKTLLGSSEEAAGHTGRRSLAWLNLFLYEVMLKQTIVFECEFNSELLRRELGFLSNSLYFR